VPPGRAKPSQEEEGQGRRPRRAPPTCPSPQPLAGAAPGRTGAPGPRGPGEDKPLHLWLKSSESCEFNNG